MSKKKQRNIILLSLAILILQVISLVYKMADE